LVGLLPDIIYTLTSPLAENPIAVFWSLHQSLNPGAMSGWYLLARQVGGTLLYTLPTVTGLANLYPVEALPLYGPPGPAMIAAVVIGGAWSLGYLALLGVATYRPWVALRTSRARRWMTKPADQMSQSGTSTSTSAQLARLLLALTAWLTIAAYMFSATAANNPHSGRYMIGLLVIVPAVLWPLMDPTPRGKASKRESRGLQWAAPLRSAWRPAALALLGVSLLAGVVSVAQTIPDEVAANGRDARFTQALLSRGVTRLYADYWTCDLINFETRERLICAVVDQYGHPGLTRYRPYYAAVRADPDAPYVLVPGSIIERTFLLHAAQSHQRYTEQSLDGHDVFTPTAP
jgi:hypothetical protein